MNNTISFHSAPHAPQITVDVNILTMLKQAASCLSEMASENVYLAAIGPDMELTIIMEEDAPSILPCFDEDDALISVKGAPLFISYNPVQVLKLAGKRYLTGPVIFYRTDGHSTIVSLTVEDKEVKVFNYVTEGTFDSYLYQTLENKQRFISQIMTSKSPVRSCEDVDEQALSYAEIKALCAGNPLIKEKMDLDVQVVKLKVLKADHQSQKFRLQDKLLTKFPSDIQEANAHIAGLKADAQLAAAHPQGKEEFCGMVIKGVTYDEKKTAGERLVIACSELPNAEEKVIGSYRGFELSLRFDAFRTEYQALLKGQRKYTVPLGNDPLGNIIRLDNSLNNFPERITAAENELTTLHQQQAAAQIEVEKPFPQEEELAEKSARLAELNTQLDVDEKSHEPEQDEEEQEDAPRRPSVLAALEEKSDKTEPVKPFKSYLDKDGDAR